MFYHFRLKAFFSEKTPFSFCTWKTRWQFYLMKTLLPSRSTLSTGSFSMIKKVLVFVQKMKILKRKILETIRCWLLWRSEERRIATRKKTLAGSKVRLTHDKSSADDSTDSSLILKNSKTICKCAISWFPSKEVSVFSFPLRLLCIALDSEKKGYFFCSWSHLVSIAVVVNTISNI